MSVGPSLLHPDGPLIRMHKERIMNDPSNDLNQVLNGRSMPVSAATNNFSQVLRMPMLQEYHNGLPSLTLPSYANVGSGAQRNFFYHGNGYGVPLLPYIKEEKLDDSRSRSPLDTKTSSLDSHVTVSPKPTDSYAEIDEVPAAKPQIKLELQGGSGRLGGVKRRVGVVGDRTINDLNIYHRHPNSANNNNNNKMQQVSSGNSPSGLMMGRSHQMLHQGQPILRYSPTGEALLTVSAVGYGGHEMLSDSAFNNQLGSILGMDPGGGGGEGGGGNSEDSGAYDMFNGEGRQENYSQDMQLSPAAFSNNAETYGINDNSNHESILEDTGRSDSVVVSKSEEVSEKQCAASGGLAPLTSNSGTKIKNGNCRPNKSSGSPNRSSTLPCPVCSKVFSNSSALAKHKLTHSDERKYVCQLCTKAFKRQDHLNGHLLTHMNKKPYECKVEGCGKSYCDARSLRRHTENHHAQVAQASAAAAAAAAVSAIAIRMAAPGTEAENNSFLAAALQNNRIRYAPPPTSTSPSTVSGKVTAGARASPKPTYGVDNTSAATQLQLLAFQQSAAVTQDPAGAPIPVTTCPTSGSASTWHQQQNVLFINSSLCRMVNEANVDKVKEEAGLGGEGDEAMSVLERHLKMEMNRAKHLQGSTVRGSSNEVPTSILPSLHSLPLSSQALPLLSFSLKNQWPAQGSTFNTAALDFGSGDPKPVECNICHRQFKNIPALNGHMRLHGGYIKRDADVLKKGSEKKSDLYPPSTSTSSHSPLHTASINVRALIEEKIIQKRITNPVLNVPLPSSTSHHPQLFLNLPPAPQLPPTPTPAMEHQHIDSHNFINLPDMIDEENVEDDLISYETSSSVLPPPPIPPPPPPRSTLSGNDVTMDEDAASSMQRQIEIIKQGLMSHQPILEKFRRHSDSDHFLAPTRPTYQEMYDPTSSASFLDYMRQKIGCKRTQRTGSDPGEFLVGAQLDADDMFAGDLEIGDLGAGDDDDVVQAADMMDFEMVESGVEPDNNSKGNHASSLLAAALCSTPTSNLMDVIEGISSPFDDHLHLVEPPIPDHDPISDGDAELRGGNMDVAEDDDVFLNPSSLPPTSPKIKKKHRPEPLQIPPQVSTCGYQSRLRSPRLWDPSMVGKIMSPPPYTPPPMLSPVRSGPGLFWHVLSGSGSITPKSAPITPGRISVAIEMVPQAYEEMSESFNEPPETDIQPHVNIGSNFQACLPICKRTYDKMRPDSHLADLVWDPKIEENLTEKELEMYLQFACCAAVPGGGRNKEYALHILHMAKGNIQEAMLKLMDPAPRLPKKHPLFTYTYAENDRWSVEEIKTYQHALIYCDKDFLSIAQEVRTKTVQQCVQFYYLWKKICPEEYKRLRIIRRKREMDGNYNLRSKLYGGDEGTDGDQAHTPKSEDRGSSPGQTTDLGVERFMCDHPDCFASFSSRQALNGHIRIHGGNNLSLGRLAKGLQDDQPYSPSTNSVTSTHPTEVLEDFPCKVCGKVFHKVKSRNAHMKSHRGTVDSDRHK